MSLTITPGPYRVATGEHANSYRYEIEATTPRGARVILARIPTPRGKPEQATANARLFAAAPDLAVALEYLLPFFDPDSLDDARHDPVVRGERAYWIQQAREALAKAKGEQP